MLCSAAVNWRVPIFFCRRAKERILSPRAVLVTGVVIAVLWIMGIRRGRRKHDPQPKGLGTPFVGPKGECETMHGLHLCYLYKIQGGKFACLGEELVGSKSQVGPRRGVAVKVLEGAGKRRVDKLHYAYDRPQPIHLLS